MRTLLLTPLALSLSLMLAPQAQAAGTVTTTASAFTPEPDCVSTDNCFKKRWIWFYSNMGKAQGNDDPYYLQLSNLIDNAKQLGYNGIVLQGSYLAMLGTPDNDHKYYNENFAALVVKARDAGIELIPSSGEPNIPIYRHPELIEALPVNEVLYTVSGTSAQADGTSIVQNKGFENGTDGWDLADTLRGTMKFDTKVGRPSDGTIPANTNSVQFISKPGVYSDNKGVARLSRLLNNLKKHTAYRVSFWMKTQNFKNDKIRFTAQITDVQGMNAVYRNFSSNLGWGTKTNGDWNDDGNKLAQDQDWTRYDFDFNTANYTQLKLFFGTWSNVMETDGYAWIDDIDVREIGLPHTVRRSTLPVKVTSADGAIVYEENRDYRINKAESEKLDILPAGRIPNNAKLLVSSYQSGRNLSSTYTTPASTCSQLYFDEQKAVYDTIDKMFAPSKYFLYYDEWRVMNWDPSCTDASAGAYLARTTAKMQETVRQVNPKLDIYIWNDMFDPTVNAVPNYFAVNGDLTNSWQGLNPSTTIVNWSTANQATSLKFFSDKNFRQMVALYYDDATLNSTKAWLNSLQTAEQLNGVKGVDGFIYTTWNGSYGSLKDVTTLIRTKFSRYWPQETPATPASH